jgi:hypothetical protein
MGFKLLHVETNISIIAAGAMMKMNVMRKAFFHVVEQR